MTRDRIAERVAEILDLAKGNPRIEAEPEAERIAWARGRAEAAIAAEDALAERRMAKARERAEAEALGTTPRAMAKARADAKAREAAERETRHLAIARLAVGTPEAPLSPPSADRGYPSLDQIEAERRKLAAAGKPHGYDALGGKGSGHPFPGQLSTIRRRYANLAPPGTPIPGLCEHAPRHAHHETRAPGTP